MKIDTIDGGIETVPMPPREVTALQLQSFRYFSVCKFKGLF